MNDREKDALRRYYREEKVLAESRRLVAAKEWEDLEEHLQMRCLFPLSRHSILPDYLRNEDGSPLFPTNLNPGKDIELWRDAVEVAWEVIEEECGLTHDEVHAQVANEQHQDWTRFMESAERRLAKRKDRQESGEAGDASTPLPADLVERPEGPTS